MLMERVTRFLFVLFLCNILIAISAHVVGAESYNKVLVLKISGVITPASDDIIANAIAKAENEGFEAFVISIDTPGGGLEETQAIVKKIGTATVPVIGYVPEGGKAWSAGTFIMMGTDIAAMAPFTVIGSAQPVHISAEGTKPIEDKKIINALTKYSVTTASKHIRNETFAEEVITKNKNIDAQGALKAGVVEYVAPSIPDLLTQVNGKVVKGKILRTESFSIENYEPPLSLVFLELISNPILSSLLLIIGFYGIVFGISSPGSGAEVFGIIAILLGLIGTGFNINVGAIFLIITGIGLLILEIKIPSFGIIGFAGLISLIIGSALLVPMGDENIYIPEFRRLMTLTVIIPTVVLGLFFVFAIYKVTKIRKKKPVIGTIIGDFARTIDPLGPGKSGFVRYNGEYWQARSEEEMGVNEKVEIIEKENEVLLIKRKT
jgi:membrane-bound serine protease (ClpP class)